jgi:hypothetical protein
MVNRVEIAMIAIFGCLISTPPLLAQGQDSDRHFEIGIVYYADAGAFKALDKETAQQSGRTQYSAKVKGAHASVRLTSDGPKVFRVCGVDPSRYKLFKFKSDRNARTLTIAKNNIWIGGSKTVISESEIPVTVQNAESGCFTLTSKTTLGVGEFGFSPAGDLDVFMFGVGDVGRSD